MFEADLTVKETMIQFDKESTIRPRQNSDKSRLKQYHIQ